VPDWLARLPWDAIAAGAMGSTDARHLGLGVVMAPKNDKDDPTSALYVIDWFMVVRAPPPVEKPAEVAPPPPADAGATPALSPAPAATTPPPATPAVPQ
jgi:hypothetical protein